MSSRKTQGLQILQALEIRKGCVLAFATMEGRKKAMLTVSEVADRLGAAKRSVAMWAQIGRFKGAKQIETPGGHYWLIPESALEGFAVRGRGRPPKPKPPAEKTLPRKPRKS